MKGFAAVPPRDGVSTLQGTGTSVNQALDASPTLKNRDGSRLVTTDSERRNGLPLTSPSTTSLQSSATVGPRSRIHRTLSRPKWLDVDANGGLLKRKTEPALATATVKGADSIGINSRDEVKRRGEDGKGKGKEKPQMRKAVTMDTISTPRPKALPSPRRRVSQSPLYISSGATTSDSPLLDGEQQEVVRSPEQEEPRRITEVSAQEREDSPGETSTPSGMSNTVVGEDTLRSTQEPKSKSPEDSEDAGLAAAVEEIGASKTDDTVTAQQNPTGDSSSQESRLWTWGKWAYTYVPAVRRPTIIPNPDSGAGTADVPVQSESASALPDLEQLAEGGIHETIGSIAASDAKDLIYDTASADEALGIETEQGIGVDPAHRSEVPFFTDNRTSSQSKGTWSLAELAMSAWNWRKGTDNISAITPGVENLPSATGLTTDDVQETEATGEQTLAEVEQPVKSARNPQAAVASASLTANPSGLEDIGNAHSPLQAEHTEDIPTLSRSAWAFATPSRWIPQRVSGVDHASTEERATDVPTSEPGVSTETDEATAVVDAQEQTPENKAAANLPQSQSAAVSSVAAPPIALTSEALEARPSPLLPSSASLVASTRPNLVLPSFNHTFRRPPTRTS
ncbi:hypothetical protein QFC20_003790 [Naganishia adeliensis]|uniref:Uncharacterized protein n=1 Tax=Naganishia adeliensis TaxID=92952 RepID=A0ACC2W762_9TREE|nr:hypothetical protein QFC20_003790 [Naganishia adeliensis]